MPVHSFHRTLIVPDSLATVWDFFSSPANLPRITPRHLGFRILTEVPPRIHAGLMIEYRVKPFAGIPLTWLTEITHVTDGRYFVDEQRSGPYRLWHHEHHFEECAEGVRMIDRVTYQLHGGWLAEPVHALFVKHTINRIFDYRTRAVQELFPAGQPGQDRAFIQSSPVRDCRQPAAVG